MAVEGIIDTCPDQAELEALCAGMLSPAQMAPTLRHVADCEPCRDYLRSAGFPTGSSAAVQPAVRGDTVKGEKALQPSPQTGTDVSVPKCATGAMASTSDAAGSAWHGTLAPPQLPDELGRLGKYRVLRVLGEGGMGIVFEAEDISLERRVAIKVLRSGEIDSAQRKRFVQEAQLAASLSSDHIVTIHQVGEEAGCLFIVMELLRGETLEDQLKRESSLPLVEALRIAHEIAEGLAAAHERRLVHRDIKPANIWLESKRPDAPPRRVKLLDFGVARPMAVHEHLTQCGNIVGTPAYMSPEQACGMPVDERSDLFSLGCVLYAMLAGKSPFERQNYLQSLNAVVHEQPAVLGELIPCIPARVARLVDRLLEKDLKARPAGARQVVDELRQLERSSTSTGLVASEPPPSVALRTMRSRQKSTWGTFAGVLAIMAAAVLGAWTQYDRIVGWTGKVAVEQADMLSVVERPADNQTSSPASAVGSANTAAFGRTGHTAAAQSQASADSAAPASERAVSQAPTEPPNSDKSPATTPPPADAAAAPADEAAAAAAELPTIKVGIIHSLSGPMAASERTIVDAFLMAVNEINEAGGLLDGRQIEALVRDGKSSEAVFAEQAEQLISDEHVVTLFGCWRSPCRKLVEEVCRQHDHLLVYPTTYEGLEQSPYVIYMGGAPNQQILPATKWAFAFLGKRKFYLIGVDGIYSRTAHEIIRDELTTLGGKVVGEGYRPLGDMNFAAIAQDVADSGADVVINTVSGSGNVSLFNCLREAGITAEKVPTVSLKVTEEELQNVSAQDHDLVGDYAVWSYFQSIPSEDNLDFVERVHARFGPTRVATDPMAAAYAGMYLWARAVHDCQSDRVADIRKAMLGEDFEAPEGMLTIDPQNHHALRKAMIGQVGEDLQYDIVWSSPKPIAPQPFPPSRTREQWQAFQNDWYQKWGGNWRPLSSGKAR